MPQRHTNVFFTHDLYTAYAVHTPKTLPKLCHPQAGARVSRVTK